MLVGWGLWWDPEINNAIFIRQIFHLKSPLPICSHYFLVLNAAGDATLFVFSEAVPEMASQSWCHGIRSSTEGTSDKGGFEVFKVYLGVTFPGPSVAEKLLR